MATAMAQTGATLPDGRFNNRYASNNMKSPDLECILEKLRPFQREAFDFATTGKSYRRQWQNDDRPNLDPNLVGKGRILLADEMGELRRLVYSKFRRKRYQMYSSLSLDERDPRLGKDCHFACHNDKLHGRMATAYSMPSQFKTHMASRD
jgi:hypothetical protein